MYTRIVGVMANNNNSIKRQKTQTIHKQPAQPVLLVLLFDCFVTIDSCIYCGSFDLECGMREWMA